MLLQHRALRDVVPAHRQPMTVRVSSFIRHEVVRPRHRSDPEYALGARVGDDPISDLDVPKCPYLLGLPVGTSVGRPGNVAVDNSITLELSLAPDPYETVAKA